MTEDVLADPFQTIYLVQAWEKNRRELEINTTLFPTVTGHEMTRHTFGNSDHIASDDVCSPVHTDNKPSDVK
jgi:hypothetical protein